MIAGMRIAATRKIELRGQVWIVPSESGRGKYGVRLDLDRPTCTCNDFELHRNKCKHIWAAEFTGDREAGVIPVLPLIEKERPRQIPQRFERNWPQYNTAQICEKWDFSTLLHELCDGIQSPPQAKGRKRIPLKDIVFAAVYKSYLTLGQRRSTPDVIDASNKGHLTRVPHYNSVYLHLQDEDLVPVLMELVTASSLPLAVLEDDVAIDATGMATRQTVTWLDTKFSKRPNLTAWRKLHFVCGTRTNVIISAIPTDGHEHDNDYFDKLVEYIPEEFRFKFLSADKGYVDANNLRLVDSLGATAYIPFKRGAKSTPRHAPIWQLMFHYYHLRRDEFLECYHRRSNAEATVSALKRVLGDQLRTRKPVTQQNDMLTRVIAHNIRCVVRANYVHGLDIGILSK
jgi:transposase